MNFVFMLTKHDRTITDCLAVMDEIAPLGLRHLGFKDIGIEAALVATLHARIKATGATSYLEVVSTSPAAMLSSARIARDIGVDYLLGGTEVDAVLDLLKGTPTQYLPFPGKPFDHPTKLAGSAALVGEQCAAFEAKGCAGVDLLAYRATEADPLALVKAARAALKGYLLVAGAVKSATQIADLKAAGADAFTIGSACFDGSYLPTAGSLRTQLQAVLDACG